jgi:hypothetical protein
MSCAGGLSPGRTAEFSRPIFQLATLSSQKLQKQPKFVLFPCNYWRLLFFPAPMPKNLKGFLPVTYLFFEGITGAPVLDEGVRMVWAGSPIAACADESLFRDEELAISALELFVFHLVIASFPK